jgi:hypothetical protein
MYVLMRTKGLEPSHLAILEPKSSASTNSAMSAGMIEHYHNTLPSKLKALPRDAIANLLQDLRFNPWHPL